MKEFYRNMAKRLSSSRRISSRRTVLILIRWITLTGLQRIRDSRRWPTATAPS